ncbi:MAG: glycosyltransferase [Anaerolineales bacterium]|nr:glycosyltransferase [Anaerolineales bacterium]
MNMRLQGRSFHGRVGLQQRVLPAYRAPFFDLLASCCHGGMSLFAGSPRSDEGVLTTERLHRAQLVGAHNIHMLRGPFYLCYQSGLPDWLQSWDPDVLILEANPRYLVNWRAVSWMQQRGRPVVGWGLGAPHVGGVSSKLRHFFRRTFLRRFDALIAYSTLGAHHYRQFGIPGDLVFVAPNAVSSIPPPLPERTATIQQPAGLLFVGRLQARKRVDLLLRACAALDTKPALTIVGDGPARRELEALATEIFPQACFVGAQQEAALGAFFRQADLFVLPGTGGLAVQQAMAHGLPVVVAEGDGTQNDLATADNGWLVSPGDLEALTETIREALSDPVRLRAMGRMSHRLVTERFNIEVMVDVFVEALNTVSRGR